MASNSGNHRGQGKAEAKGVMERRRVVTCDGLMVANLVDEFVAWGWDAQGHRRVLG